jgi:5-methylcytosine-specific restriction endonuclease McrA
LTVEHIFPKSKGGTRGIENITLTCAKCNQIKKDMYPFLDCKNRTIKSVPMPIPVLPNKPIQSREEWQKYFIYKKI